MTITTVTHVSPWWGTPVLTGGFSVGGALVGGLATQLYNVWNGSRDHAVRTIAEQDRYARKAVLKFMNAYSNHVHSMVVEKSLSTDAATAEATMELQLSCSDAIVKSARAWNRELLALRKKFRAQGVLGKDDSADYYARQREFLAVVRDELGLDPLSNAEAESVARDPGS